jgi:hypothetical protein
LRKDKTQHFRHRNDTDGVGQPLLLEKLVPQG